MNKTFPIVRKGYDPEAVDTYISELEEIISSYKEKDIAIKNALVNAQIAADNIVKNAEIQADTYKLKAMEKMSNIKESVKYQKGHLDNFRNDYNRLMQKYLKDFNDYDLVSVDNKIDELHDFINDVINDKNVNDLEQTKVVKSIKSEYKEQNTKNTDENKKNIDKGAFEEETPLEPINLIDNKQTDLNKSIDSYTHKKNKKKKKRNNNNNNNNNDDSSQ